MHGSMGGSMQAWSQGIRKEREREGGGGGGGVVSFSIPWQTILPLCNRPAEHEIRKAAWLVVCLNNAHFDQSLVQFVQTFSSFLVVEL